MYSPHSDLMSVSVVSGDHARADRLCAALDAAGVYACPANFETTSDAVLFDLTTCSPALVSEMADYASDCGPDRPLLVTLGHFEAEDAPQLMVDVRLSSDAALALAPVRLQFARRILARKAERALRVESLNRFGFEAPAPKRRKGLQFLYVGDASTVFPVLQRQLARGGHELAAAFSGYTAFDYLHDTRFDAVIVDTRAPHIRADAFCDMLSRSPNLTDTPILALIDDAAPLQPAILQSASDLIDGAASVHAIQRQLINLARDVDEDARLCCPPMGEAADTITGLFARGFFEAHLQRQIDWALDFDQPLSLIVIRIEDDTATSDGRALGHAAGLLKSLLRAQDTPSRIDWTTLMVSMPGADQSDAIRAARRISNVLDATAFETGMGSPSRQVNADCRVLELEEGQGAHAFLSDALALGPRRKGVAA